MRIGMLAETYKPHVSGITNYISLNKRVLEAAGHEVYVFTFGDTEYVDDEPNVIRSPGLSLTGTDYYISFRYPQPVRRLLYTMDVAHVHHPFLSGTLALRYCRPRGIPIVFTNHTRYDLYAQAYIKGVPDVISAGLLQTFMPPFTRSCDLVIAPSEGMRKVLERFGVDSPVEVIPNGVCLESFSGVERLADRCEYGYNPEDCVLIYTGRLGPEKNLPFLIRAFAGVAGAYEHARLLIVGGGPERDNLEDRVSTMGLHGKVRFTGMVPYDELPRYLAVADAFVTASVTEVHPLSVIEAMAAGLPVLGIQSPGVGDTVVDGETGFLSEEDLAGFTARMARLVSQKSERLEMGERARQAAQKYDIQRTSKLMEAVYTRLVSQAAGRKRAWRARFSRFMDRLRP